MYKPSWETPHVRNGGQSVGVRFKVDKGALNRSPSLGVVLNATQNAGVVGNAGKAGRLMHVPSLDTSVPVKPQLPACWSWSCCRLQRALYSMYILKILEMLICGALMGLFSFDSVP